MKIDRKLNLIVPVERDGGTLYVHSTPISREVFERYFLTISRTFAAIYQQGLNVVAGPRIAALMLKRLAIDAGEWEGEDGVENGLVAEVRRLSNLISPVPGGGWGAVPLQTAIAREMLTQEELDEVEGAVTFFIVASAMHRQKELPAILAGLSRLWDAQTSSLNCTEFANTLRTSTEDAPTGETGTPSSIPS